MENETILVVEDNTDLLENNCEYLSLKGYRVLAAETLAAACGAMRNNPVHLVLLDVNLPDGSGFAFAAEVPEAIAILYLTGRTAEEDVVRGLSRDSGRVDYLRKPFSYAELIARIRALLNTGRAVKEAPVLMCGPLRLDMAVQRAYLEEEDMQLTPKEFVLLLQLAKNRGKLLSKQALYEEVWRQPLLEDDNALLKQISRLKKKLEANGTLSLSAIRGEGYRLTIKE